MGELLKFPTTQEPAPSEVVNVLEFKKKKSLDTKEGNIRAYLSEDDPNITIGGEIVVEVLGKKYRGVITDILQKDLNYNITKIAYSIPFLNGDDQFKFGEADFTYSIKKYD